MPTQPPKVPPGVWVLGFVSMFMDISSEMVHSLLPMYLVGVLGASLQWTGQWFGLQRLGAQWAGATMLLIGLAALPLALILLLPLPFLHMLPGAAMACLAAGRRW